MQYTWTNQQNDPVKIKKFLQNIGMGHRLIADIKHGDGSFIANDHVVQPTDVLPPHSQITVIINPEKEDETIVASHQPIDIVFENDQWLVINKPAGLTSIPGPTNRLDTLLNRIKGYLIDQGSKDLRPHFISRLDRFTSGLVLVAKNRLAQSLIANQVEQHLIDKQYWAIVSGQVSEEHGFLSQPVGRVADSPRRAVMNNGQSAKTEYWREQVNDSWTLVRVKLHTGRTHQIRVHFSNIGHPLLGDQLYDGPLELISRQALHAYHIEFVDPFDQQTRMFEAAIPEDMKNVLDGK